MLQRARHQASSAANEYRGQPAVPKGYRSGTHRAVSPDKTLARIEPLLPVFGITRIANITGLDCLGIPVFMACRPNSRSLAVFQGKGLDPAAARASAIMEAVETFHAETIDLPLKYGAVEEICYSHAIAEIHKMPFSKEGNFDPLCPIFWIEGEDLLNGGRKWLPFELVHANYTLPHLPGSGSFAATTNGLASGNVKEEAISHGLYEVIERDAITLWKLSGDQTQAATVVDPHSIDDPACRDLIDRIKAAGMDLVIWDITSDIGLPAFQCLIAGRDRTVGAPEFGSGCHLSRPVALARALTEAAQARTTYITGARDDITARDYAADAVALRHDNARALVADHVPARSFQDIPHHETDCLASDLEHTLSALADSGITEVMHVDLSKQALNIPVSRVVVPGLESLLEGPHSDYLPGERALKLLEATS
ncbi:YcaO-like family protein [Aestuariispira insulae]|uniref:Ribosomal protein S12 methylthiotransferase accessory factor n=1 Tax=Aestuariispira insulae TaxID=1461337 RepID=A0A3D9HGU3_9PROT|nr:YcaO-like family protein [Aestuariispira insulae]RED48625.1 ribosomal protein S12 methylthiotransferase accessory factor [Aestuariispira insulae]